MNVSLNSKLYCNRALAASKVGRHTVHLILPYNIHNSVTYICVRICLYTARKVYPVMRKNCNNANKII